MSATEVLAPPTTQTIHIGVTGQKPVVTPHTTKYGKGQKIIFVSDCAVYLEFGNYDVFDMDGVCLEARKEIELTPNDPYETKIFVSMEKQQTAGALITGGLALMKAYCADPPKIIPGG